MKKKFSRILGVSVTLVLLASVLAFTAPVSAGTLSWSDETIPTTDDKVIGPSGVDVNDLAVGPGRNAPFLMFNRNPKSPLNEHWDLC